MTEKRFDDAKGYVYDGKNCIGIINDDFTCENIINLLNTFNDENEQLKQSIKEVVELVSEEVDVFSEKATEYDIIAYTELNQLDNKDAYYMATATKKAIRMLKGCLND